MAKTVAYTPAQSLLGELRDAAKADILSASSRVILRVRQQGSPASRAVFSPKRPLTKEVAR